MRSSPDNRKAKDVKLLQVILVVCIPIFLIFLPFRILVFNEAYYNFEFGQLDVYSDAPEADAVLVKLFRYMRHGEPEVEEFNERENSHLIDVKRIFDYIFILFSVSFFVSIIASYALIKKDKKAFYRSLFIASIVPLALAVLLMVFLKLNFSWSFDIFHRAFFAPGTYTFNPDTEMLKAMFPNAFFEHFAFYSMLATTMLSMLGLLASRLLAKYSI
ncbi:DUF1461 domain-containing protein [Candidatus Woesearchaeota archaeon]|nr:DUF1461 domain-containing protein [Candidatus Woesearchaeota archaeon]